MKRIGISVLALLILLTGCRQKQPNAKAIVIEESHSVAPLKVEKLREIQLKNLTGLEPTPKILATPDNILVFHFDGNNSRAKKMFCDAYSHQLEWKWRKKFLIGQGPGDIAPACRFFLINNQIYCLEYSMNRVSIFDLEMTFQGSMDKTPSSSNYSFFSKDGNHYYGLTFSRGNIGCTIWKMKVGQSGRKTIATFDPYNYKAVDREKNLFFRKARPDKILFPHGDQVFFLNCKEYSIYRTNDNAVIDKAIRYITPEITLSPDENKENMIAFRKKYRVNSVIRGKKIIFAPFVQPASGVACLKKGFVVFRRKDYKCQCINTTEGDYFSYDLIHKGKVQFPCYISNFDQFGFNTQQLWKNGIYLVQEAGEDEESDYLTYWEIKE